MSRRSPASMPCPNCGSEDTSLITIRGRPVRSPGGAVLRGHECHSCGHRYLSIQRTMTHDAALDVA